MTEQQQGPTVGVLFRELSVFQRWPLKKRSLCFCIRSKCSIERDAGTPRRTWVKQQKVTTRGTGLERNITRFEFSHVARYNLGQNLLIHITKILIFCTRPPKKSPQIESPFHASPIPMLFAVTPEMHTWTFRPKQLWTRIGGGGGGDFCSR